MVIIRCLFLFISAFSCQQRNTSPEDPVLKNEPITEGKVPTKYPESERHIQSEADIRKEYTSVISKLESRLLDSTSFSYNCKEEKRGTVTFFSERGQLRLVRHRYAEYSHFSALESYFVKDSTLFFVLQKQVSWNFVAENQTEDKVTENRIYIIKNAPVKCLQKKFTIVSNSNDGALKELANKEIACATLKPVLEKFALLVNHRNNRQTLNCLED